MKDPRTGIVATLSDRELLDKLLADDELTEHERSVYADWRAKNLRAIQRERMQLDNERMQRWNLRWQKWIACGTVTSALVSFTSLLLAIWALGCSCGARH